MTQPATGSAADCIHPRSPDFRCPCPHLLAAFGLLFLIYPFLEGSLVGAGVLDLFIAAVLVSAVYAVRRQRSVLITALALGVPAMAIALASHLLDTEGLILVGHGLGIAFYGVVGVVMLRRVLEDGAVGTHRLIAAACVYLLLGLVWALCYSLLEHFSPGSYEDATIAAQPIHGVLAGQSRLIYYSLTTLTTLGYGDVVPTTPPARALSNLEAVCGQLYLTVLVARLVGLHIAHARGIERPPSDDYSPAGVEE